MAWKHVRVNVKLALSFGYDADGFKVSKSDIEEYLVDHMIDLIKSGAFKPLIKDIQSSYDIPTTVAVDLV
jgi:hypothetical protein